MLHVITLTTIVLMATSSWAQVLAPADIPEEELIRMGFNLTCEEPPCNVTGLPLDDLRGNLVSIDKLYLTANEEPEDGHWQFELFLKCSENDTEHSWQICGNGVECLKDHYTTFNCPFGTPIWFMYMDAWRDNTTADNATVVLFMHAHIDACSAEVCMTPPTEGSKKGEVHWAIFLGAMLAAAFLLFIVWVNRVGTRVNRRRNHEAVNSDIPMNENPGILKELPQTGLHPQTPELQAADAAPAEKSRLLP
eukprot:TRINITY_DN1601_c3_g2_i1.p1 TRINITY_DN1601_c3_g2~~TRINITY_DN1601_c3_g2_i1.p1  ORF type:complete len:271 (+),score=42.52 TRINITY_DN1601_c3_g2_i1:66-815(+)